LLALLALTLTACPGGEDELPGDCDEETYLTWENTGEPFLLTWCTPCHSSHLSGAEGADGQPNARQDAPLGSDFDTYESYLEFQIDVYNRSAASNDQMPPAGGPSTEERALLGEWIACGSPQ